MMNIIDNQTLETRRSWGDRLSPS